jgi:endonuclease YncB( thermonuclease family)
MFLSLRSLSQQPTAPVLSAAAFFAGVVAATTVAPLFAGRAPVEEFAVRASDRAATLGVPYPAEVLRVLDGDTFEARVRVWPGLDITTRVRLRGIDAPELHARCHDERMKAEAARDVLSSLLSAGGVGITHVGLDKYGGRVLADASTRLAASVSETMLAGGHVRRYAGGHRAGWCLSAN